MKIVNKLKPCPFCGCEDFGVGHGTKDREGWPVFVYCGTCGAQGPWKYMGDLPKTVDEAATATGWNTRSSCVRTIDTTRRQTCAYLHDGQKIVLKRDVKTGAAWLEIQPQAEIKPQ